MWIHSFPKLPDTASSLGKRPLSSRLTSGGLHSVLSHLMGLRMFTSLSAARVEDGGDIPAAKLAIFSFISKSHFPPDIVMNTCSFFFQIYLF